MDIEVRELMEFLGWHRVERHDSDGAVSVSFGDGRPVSDGVSRMDGDTRLALAEAAIVALVGGHQVIYEMRKAMGLR